MILEEKLVPSKIGCELCRAYVCSMDEAMRDGWDWFTGYLDRAHHYCKKHATSAERNLMYQRSQAKP